MIFSLVYKARGTGFGIVRFPGSRQNQNGLAILQSRFFDVNLFPNLGAPTFCGQPIM